METTSNILDKILLPLASCWSVQSVEVDETSSSIYVDLVYNSQSVFCESGISYPIFDYRSKRTWRHLDLWQYKTYLRARLPRNKVGDRVKTVSVPWADSLERMTLLLEKKR